jgi:TDG/mug DNA glycosylase family protein
MALAGLHRRLERGAVVTISVTAARRWDRARIDDVFEGAGFDVPSDRTGSEVSTSRLLTLPDTVGPDMRMLVCGLNPSVHAAEMGIGFGRPGNRFWPAALAAGVVTVDRDPDHALRAGGVGMTDMVKRATPRAIEIGTDEYAMGMGRLERMVRWLGPRVVCMVGLSGWRSVVDQGASPGLQDTMIGGRPVYLMPSTSGLNAHCRLDDLTDHLKAAWQLGLRY